MSPARNKNPRGFTLLEVLLASFIFAITMSALLMTFRTGIKAWEVSHSASETFQTARVAQDVILRDVNSVFFISEDFYNINYRANFSQFGRTTVARDREAANRRRGRNRSSQENRNSGEDEFDQFILPVNLSFVGTDRGRFDEIEFAVHQSAWTPDSERTWGISRVRYFIQDNVLYREETMPYETPSGQSIEEDLAWRIESLGRGDEERVAMQSDLREALEGALASVPSTPPIVEPLCRGIELFNITYGYYKGEQWNEVDDWDSRIFRYRFPEGDEGDAGFSLDVSQMQRNFASREETNFNPISGLGQQRVAIINGQSVPFGPRPDDLPGYLAIQVALRDSDEGGRLNSFTFFGSFSEAQEELDLGGLEDAGFSAGTRLIGMDEQSQRVRERDSERERERRR